MSDQTSTPSGAPDGTRNQTRHTAGAFDIRTFIAMLMGIFGVILVLHGIIGDHKSSSDTATGGAINVWVGICLIVFAALMQGWALWRPTIVDEAQVEADKEEDPGDPHA